MISQKTIEQVKEQANILDIVGETVALRRQGSNYTGLCPFHAEKTPSFFVRDNDQSYHCFGCGKRGNVISFIMETRGLSFPEAVEELASRYGIEIVREGGKKPGSSESRKNEYHSLNKIAQEFFLGSLAKPDSRVVAYIENRGLSSESLKVFGVGFAPNQAGALLSFLRSRKVTDDLMVSSGLIRRNQRGELYDSFRGRLVFPIWIDSKKIAGFGGRVIPTLFDPEAVSSMPKYLNSPETPAYQKSKILYGLPQALGAIRATGELYVVEGYMDVIGLWQAGVENVVATCGTALTSEHIKRISRLAKRVIVLFDGDSAGKAASARAFATFLNSDVDVWALFLPDNEDPDSVARSYGQKTLEYLGSLERISLLDCYIDAAIKSFGVNEISELGAASVGKIANDVAAVLSKVEDPIARDHLVEKARLRLRVKTEAFAEVLKGKGEIREIAKVSSTPEESSTKAVGIDELPRVDRELLYVAMARRERVSSLILHDAEMVQSLHPTTVRFIEGLDRIVQEEKLPPEVKKELTLSLLGEFGESWKRHWREAYDMQGTRMVDLEQTYEQCRVSIKKQQLNQTLLLLDKDMSLASDDREREGLAKEKVALARRLSELRGGFQ